MIGRFIVCGASEAGATKGGGVGRGPRRDTPDEPGALPAVVRVDPSSEEEGIRRGGIEW